MKSQEFDCNLLEIEDLTIYAYAALKAYCIIVRNNFRTLGKYEEAWNDAIKEKTDKKSNITKGCPRKTFIGLCEEGYLKGVQKISNKNYGANKNYAIEALKHLKKNPHEKNSPKILWKKLVNNIDSDTKVRKCYNQQMHVVLALWNENLIV